jgi:very-short-patch-repair endonuclease
MKIKNSTKETMFLYKLVQQLKVFGVHHWAREYYVDGKRIDLYLPEINVAIEYDEKVHKYYSVEDEEIRQRAIEEKLNCTFIRVPDSNNDETNCALVLKELLALNLIHISY